MTNSALKISMKTLATAGWSAIVFILGGEGYAQTPPQFNDRLLVFLWAEDPDDPGPSSWRALGSGFILGEDGEVLTARHVVENLVDGERIVASVASKSAYPVRVDATDIECAGGAIDACFLKLAAGSLTAINVGEFANVACYDIELDDRLRASGFIGGGEQSAGSSHPTGTVISTQLPGNLVGTNLALEPTMSGGPVTDFEGNVVALVKGAAGNNLTVITPLNRVRSMLEDRGFECNIERTTSTVVIPPPPQSFLMSGEVRCQGGGATGTFATRESQNICWVAPPGWSISGPIEIIDQSGQYHYIGPAQYESTGAGVCVEIACDPPDQPFGPGGWVSIKYSVQAVQN